MQVLTCGVSNKVSNSLCIRNQKKKRLEKEKKKEQKKDQKRWGVRQQRGSTTYMTVTAEALICHVFESKLSVVGIISLGWLVLWDAIVRHPNSLTILVRIFATSRTRWTRTLLGGGSGFMLVVFAVVAV